MTTLNTIPDVRPVAGETQKFRSHIGHISRQSSVFFAGTLFTAVSGYLFKVYLARVLGAESLGIYALGMTIVGFLSVFNALGLPQAAVRFVSAYSVTGKTNLLRGFLARGLLWLLGSNLLLGGGVLLMGPWIAIHFYHTPALGPYMVLFALIMLLGALNAFLGQTLAGYKDVARRTTITNFIGTPAMMLLTVALLAWGLGLRGYILAQVAGAVLILALLVRAVWQLTPPEARSLTERMPALEKEVISFSAAAFGVAFLEFLMSQGDKVLIGFYLNPRDVGIYAVAAALVTFVPVILQSVNQIFSPTIADLYVRGERELLGRIFQTLTKWILGLTLPLATAMMVFAQPLMRIFGRDFEAGWAILVIGTFGQLVNCAVGSVGYLLLMSGQQKKLVQIQAVMAPVMILMSLLLIPRWGITGAAVGAAVTNVVNNVWYLLAVRRALGLTPYNRSFFKLVLPACSMLVTLLAIRAWFPAQLAEWIAIVGGALAGYAVFVAVSLGFGLNADDRMIAEAAWSKAKGLFPWGEA